MKSSKLLAMHNSKLKVKNKQMDRGAFTAVYVEAYVITYIIDGIKKHFDDKTNSLKAKIKALKEKNLATLEIMFDNIKIIKSILCFNIRNSNFFFFDFLSFTIIDLYFRRNEELQKTSFKHVTSDQK